MKTSSEFLVILLCVGVTVAPVFGDEKIQRADQNTVKVTPQVSGVILVLGTEIKPGDKVPAKDVVAMAGKKYRRLANGDRVTEGQIVAVLDDRLARFDLQVKESKLIAAIADHFVSQALYEEAKATVATNKFLFHRKCISVEEYRRSIATKEKYFHEMVAKEHFVKLAGLEIEQAKLTLEMYQVRSPAAGIVQAIYKTRGEGVKALDSILQIKVAEKK